jgi:tetratricopeptide (TPR) repeat protein
METSASLPLQGIEYPNYRNADARGHYHASFSDGVPVSVASERARWYPRVRGSAPCMAAVYEAVAASLTDEKLIWDVGCGAGVGTHILRAEGREVIGLDNDLDALEFAKRFSPGHRYLRFPLHGEAERAPDVMLLVDVLGTTEDPRRLLWQLRSACDVSTRLVVVEQRAYGSQTLVPPARRAFSTRSLESLLTRSGWQFDSAELLGETLVICTATPEPGQVGKIFDAAETARLRGDATAARQLLAALMDHTSKRVHCQAALELADLAFQMGDGDSVVEALRQVSSTDPQEPGANAGMARLELALGNTSDALMLAVQALERDPCDARTAVAFAQATELAAPGDASEAWGLAAALAADDVQVLTNRARVCASEGQLELSIATLEQLRAYHPAPAIDLSVTLGWLLLDAGRVADAQLEARMAATLAPDDDEVKTLQAALAAAVS